MYLYSLRVSVKITMKTHTHKHNRFKNVKYVLPAERHVGLSALEHPGEGDLDTVKGHTLRLVDREGPG